MVNWNVMIVTDLFDLQFKVDSQNLICCMYSQHGHYQTREWIPGSPTAPRSDLPHGGCQKSHYKM